jgi:thermostable 8-oxoguanine DNA glycosylase
MEKENQMAVRFRTQLANLNKEEFLEIFNKEVGGRGWTSARAFFLVELRNAFRNLEVDITEVTNDSGGFKLNREAIISANKLILI